MSLKRASHKADVDLWVKVKGSFPSSLLGCLKMSCREMPLSQTHDSDMQVGCAELCPGVATWPYRAPSNLILSWKGYHWMSWDTKCIRTIAPIWIMSKAFFLWLSLIMDAEIWAVNRMDEAILPKPYAPTFWQSVVHKVSLSLQLYLGHCGSAL